MINLLKVLWRKILEFQERADLYLDYYANRQRMPFHWGNVSWYGFKDKLLVPGSQISDRHDEWHDYSVTALNSTAELLEPTYRYYKQRKLLNDQILGLNLFLGKDAISDQPTCIFTSGGTASGKTSAVDNFLKTANVPEGTFLRLDFDRIKREIPEYRHMLDLKIKSAASFVQSESIKIGGRLFKEAIKAKINIIYEKTLDSFDKAEEDIEKLRKKGYSVYVVATHVPMSEGLKRAEERYLKMGRYVPEEIIQRIYQGIPSTLYEIRHLVDGILLFDNEDTHLQVMLYTSGRTILSINRSLYQKYLNTVGHQFDLVDGMEPAENTDVL